MGAIISELSTCLVVAAVLGLWIGWIVQGKKHEKKQKREDDAMGSI